MDEREAVRANFIGSDDITAAPSRAQQGQTDGGIEQGERDAVLAFDAMQVRFELREDGCARERRYCKRLMNKTLVQTRQRCRTNRKCLSEPVRKTISAGRWRQNPRGRVRSCLLRDRDAIDRIRLGLTRLRMRLECSPRHLTNDQVRRSPAESPPTRNGRNQQGTTVRSRSRDKIILLPLRREKRSR